VNNRRSHGLGTAEKEVIRIRRFTINKEHPRWQHAHVRKRKVGSFYGLYHQSDEKKWTKNENSKRWECRLVGG